MCSFIAHLINTPFQMRIFLLLAFLLTAVGCKPMEELEQNLVPATVDEDPLLPQVRIEVAGRSRAVHLETFGNPQNPVLLVLHGSLGDYRALLPFQALADRYYVVMWDQRGNGLSERITESEIGAEFVVEEIDRLRERFSPNAPITLLGHSFGAMYSALYISERPQHVRQAALLEPAGLNSRTMKTAMENAFRLNLLDAQFGRRSWANTTLTPQDHAELDYQTLALLRGNEMQYYCDNDNKPKWPVWRCGAYLDYIRGKQMMDGATDWNFDFAHGLSQFPDTVLLVGGTCSAIGDAFQRDHIAPLFPAARVVAIADAGHRLPLEQFNAVLDSVKTYLLEYR
jgi:proline iminopeptidase